jgi:hypothetical protein
VNHSPNRPIPAVDPQVLRAVWDFFEQARAKFPGIESSALNVDVRLLAGICRPGANPVALIMRRALIDLWVDEELDDRQKGAQLEGPMFEIAAAFPIPRLDRFNPDDFLKQMNDRGSWPS